MNDSIFEQDLPKTQANHVALSPLTFIERSASIYPDYPAVIHGDIRRSWRETWARCRRLASALEKRGIKPGETVLVEPTSGNTGIGLAFVAAARGYTLKLVMPESMSVERRKILAHLGAELVLTPAAGGMPGAIDKANQLLAEIPGAVQPSQFENPANPLVHEKTTAEEIWNDTGGNVDVLLVGVGPG